MRRFQLAAITCLQGAVACSSYETSENKVPDAGTAEGGAVVDTPVSSLDPTRTCVPKPPGDWQGPLIVFEGSGSPPPTPPACPPGYRTDTAFDGNANLVAPDASCKCECGPEAGSSCTAKLTFFNDKTCLTPCVSGSEAVVGPKCTALPASCGGAKAAMTYKPGTCQAKQIDKTTAPTAWSSQARLCAPIAPSDAGCAADRTSTPTTSLPFATNTYCIAKTGEDECPPIYPRKRVYYAAVRDDRDCECSCKSATGGSCSGDVQTADDATTCVAGIKIVETDGGCYETKKAGGIFPAVIKPGACEPESKPKGAATPTTPTTVCCTR